MSPREPSGASKSQKAAFSKTLKNPQFSLMFLDPEASKRTSRGPRRLLRDTQRDTQRWSKHWSNSGQIVNPKTSKNKQTKNRLPCLQDIFKKPQKTSKSEIFKVPQKSIIQAQKVTFSKNLKKLSFFRFLGSRGLKRASRDPRRVPEAPRGSQRFPEVPEAPRRSQRFPEAPRGSQRLPEAPGSQKLPKDPRSSQRLPEAPPRDAPRRHPSEHMPSKMVA